MGVTDDPRNVGLKVQLGGRDLVMRFTVKAQRLMKQADGGKNPNGPGGLLNRLDEQDPDDIATVFWALLYDNEPRPSVDEIAEWIDLTNLAPMFAAFNDLQKRNNRAAEGSPADPQ